jgi:hypothetical protein
MQQATRLDPLPLNSLLEVLPDGIAFVDEYGVICHVNERLESLTGYARDFLSARPSTCSYSPGTKMLTPRVASSSPGTRPRERR